jgi:hypothetical protein
MTKTPVEGLVELGTQGGRLAAKVQEAQGLAADGGTTGLAVLVTAAQDTKQRDAEIEAMFDNMPV